MYSKADNPDLFCLVSMVRHMLDTSSSIPPVIYLLDQWIFVSQTFYHLAYFFNIILTLNHKCNTFRNHISFISAFIYGSLYFISVLEKKSQYKHRLAQKGTWMYKPAISNIFLTQRYVIRIYTSSVAEYILQVW